MGVFFGCGGRTRTYALLRFPTSACVDDAPWHLSTTATRSPPLKLNISYIGVLFCTVRTNWGAVQAMVRFLLHRNNHCHKTQQQNSSHYQTNYLSDIQFCLSLLATQLFGNGYDILAGQTKLLQ